MGDDVIAGLEHDVGVLHTPDVMIVKPQDVDVAKPR